MARKGSPEFQRQACSRPARHLRGLCRGRGGSVQKGCSLPSSKPRDCPWGTRPHSQSRKLPLVSDGHIHGSFGFDLEEAEGFQVSLLDQESPVEVAIGQTKTIFESLVSDEEKLADAIAETDNRALIAVRGFLQIMADSEAVCSLSFRNDTFRFRDIGQVKQGLISLESDNIQEDEETLHGYFQGFLPRPRRAQLTIDESGEVLLCRVDQSVEDAEEINNNLYRSVDVTATSRRVGSSRPRYTIVGYEFSSDDRKGTTRAT